MFMKDFNELQLKECSGLSANHANNFMFCLGYLSQLVQGKGIKECVQGAHYAGNTIIRQHGCTFPEKCTFE